MEPKKQHKQPIKKSGGKTPELKTEPPISEKDEVKQAEDRMKSPRKSS
ncbi:MAG: hypothetical protein ACTHNW_20295 [Mucilaginibacter sp.]